MFSRFLNHFKTSWRHHITFPTTTVNIERRWGPSRGILAPLLGFITTRWTTYGQEYQPSSLRRKRKVGYLARLRSRNGRKVLLRRIDKGRKYLSA